MLFDYGERFYARILDLPPQTTGFLLPDGATLTPERAAAIKQLPPACWAPALYMRDWILPASDQADGRLPVVVTHGRWIVRCGCGGSQYACAIDRRFLCDRCRNAAAGGRWLAIQWPEDPNAIELALKPRLPEHQNWLPGESVAQLYGENDLHDRIRLGAAVDEMRGQ